ncbi:MAG: hypothetical protein WAU47_00550 [Desulfobaccales bacterium]
MIVSEYYQRLRTTMENAKAVLARHHTCGYGPISGAYCDPSSPETQVVFSEILGVKVQAPRRGVEMGQEMVRQWLKVRPDGKPGLLFHHRCQNLIRELRNYREHEPGKGEHHALDALRYFFCGWPGA